MSRKYAQTAADLHRAWLELVDTDGPFIAVPALERLWPQGIPQPDARALNAIKDAKPAFEKAWENWDERADDEAALDLYREARDTWVNLVLSQGLRWGTSYTVPAPASVEVHSPDYTVSAQASGALVHADTTGALVLVTDPAESLRHPVTDGWTASPIDRMEELLRASGVPIGVVTDGRWWAIVSTRPQTVVASGIVDAQTWIEEPQTRNAFIELLQRRRLIGGKPQDRLTELFGESVTAAEKITEALGTQVRRAVELIVQALSEGALEARRRGEADPLPAQRGEVYEAAVTVMMRVVFLLFAEERGLLPQGRLFAMGYGISDELELLDAREKEEGAQALDATFLTWHRLLATSQALYRGASFEDLRLPEYGGSLFDPARFGFLTACDSQDTLAITVSDRVMLEVLRAVQIAQLPGGARRISFRDVDVEQIGYIYEGLLGYSCEPAEEIVIGLTGSAGSEPEIPLATLEELSQAKQTEAALADAILAWVKANQPAAKPASKTALAKALKAGETLDDIENVLRDVTDDPELRERLRPFIGIIRRDLRGRPLVVEPGGVLVVETPSRASAGAHYTPRSLAEEVVRYSLEPLVYAHGPHQTANQDAWRPLDSDQILELRIADIACGSGAFLVAAARYLAGRLVEAWQREDVTRGRTPNDLLVHAIRTVVATCLYGADINGMAVEMCKLSLWLVSLDPKLPFSFVDDKVLHGNALLGLTHADQLRQLHIDPAAAGNQLSVFALDVDNILDQATRLRRQLATEVDDNDPQRSAATKRRQYRRYQELTEQLADVADGVVAAGLRWGGKPGRQLKAAYENLRLAVERAYPADGGEADRTMLDGIQEAGLTPTVTTDYNRWKPLHWILAVPDVMESGGFHAIIGNPPFLTATKISPAISTQVREWAIWQIARGKSGKADLVVYFFTRALQLLSRTGSLGLIGTNSIAQVDSRKVGLATLLESGMEIYRAVRSRPWPGGDVSLEYAVVWATHRPLPPSVRRTLDEKDVTAISSLLEATNNTLGEPHRLSENQNQAFLGCKIRAEFVVDCAIGLQWIQQNAATQQVVRSYFTGDDVNNMIELDSERMAIDFTDVPEGEVVSFAEPFEYLRNEVRKQRQLASSAGLRGQWWQLDRAAQGMRRATSKYGEVLAFAEVSSTIIPRRIQLGPLFNHKVVIIATDSYADQAVLSSSAHWLWVARYSKTNRVDPSYSPSVAYETFPRPQRTAALEELGRTLEQVRTEIMTRRALGLTSLYRLVNGAGLVDDGDVDVTRLRQLHVELDRAVLAGYGWSDLISDHGFHPYRQMPRWTVGPETREKILDRLLEENHRRAASQGVVRPTSNNEVTKQEEGDE
ncbi:Eco57I restriction-modification methylase domain-containing protein [Streptomyces sp. NPDC005149]